MSVRLGGIVEFVQAVECGSFALAGERLHLSRSAVGKTIARLEERLGVRLFHRTTRTLTLTEDGEIYYERCLRALAELESAEAAFESGRREPTGKLRVTVPVLFGRHCVAPCLVGLMREYPALTVEMAFSDRPVDLIAEGFDLAVRIGRQPDSANLVARHLAVQRMGICASPSYLAAHGRPGSADDLLGHSGIVYARDGYDRPWYVRDGNGDVRELRMNARLRMDDLQSMVDAAVAGAGLAWLPCWLIAQHVREGTLELITACELVLPTEIHAVWPQTPYLPSKTRAVIEALARGVPELMGSGERPALGELMGDGVNGACSERATPAS
ncbi:LysR substrate-binding domain-containing protein [Arhodomonas sp. AD133]|uniref:LysR substrate-binding domain-containing protein n=1 Tax=Arhodomonas sp. AD133 TaxID=3415009 RepID=UPI003EBE3704